MIDDDLRYVECEACSGEGVPLGRLADLEWFRCRACGLVASLRIGGPDARADVRIEPAGALMLLRPRTRRGLAWLEAHFVEPPRCIGDAVLCLAPIVGALYEQMIEAGLEVE